MTRFRGSGRRRFVRNFQRQTVFITADMNDDEHDDLWLLLGKARKPVASPFFSRNVLRAIREEQPERGTVWHGWLLAHWRKAALAMIVVLIATSIEFAPKHDPTAALDPLDQAAQEVASSPDFSVIENLDALLASEDNDVWLADSTH